MHRGAEHDQRVRVHLVRPLRRRAHQHAQHDQKHRAERVAAEQEPFEERREAGVHLRQEDAEQQQRQSEDRRQDHAEIEIGQHRYDDRIQYQKRTNRDTDDPKHLHDSSIPSARFRN